LTQLKPGVEYTINCSITSTGATKMHFAIDGAVFIYQTIPAQLNGTGLKTGLAGSGANGALNPGENVFNVTTFTRSIQFGQGSATNLEFTNLDDAVVATVHDCSADVELK